MFSPTRKTEFLTSRHEPTSINVRRAQNRAEKSQKSYYKVVGHVIYTFLIFFMSLCRHLFSDGSFSFMRSLSPPAQIRPGGEKIFLSSIERHRRCHISNGNSVESDSDPGWKPFQSPPRSHKTKKKRGLRGAGARNFRPPPPPPSPSLSPLPRKRRRVFVNNEIKVRAVNEYESLLEISSHSEAAESFRLIFPSIPLQNMFLWRRKIDTLREDVRKVQFRRITVSQAAVAVRSEPWFPEAENCVFSLFEDARENGLSCSTLWFSTTMKKQLLRLFPGREADDFVAGAGWLRRFFKRRGLSMRVSTNVMPMSVKERVPQCLSFYETIQSFCAEEGKMNPTWGRFTPDHRFNADEVGVEFGCILRRTAEKKAQNACGLNNPNTKSN